MRRRKKNKNKLKCDLGVIKRIGQEFKAFATRGNAVDLAVGIVIGAAFGRIVNSLVNDILMPLIGLILGGRDFSTLAIEVGPVSIAYGSFIQNIVDFLFIAAGVFIFVKLMNKLHSRNEKIEVEDKEVVKKEDEQITILKEIRDELKK